jgi:hypothetical protein
MFSNIGGFFKVVLDFSYDVTEVELVLNSNIFYITWQVRAYFKNCLGEQITFISYIPHGPPYAQKLSSAHHIFHLEIQKMCTKVR